MKKIKVTQVKSVIDRSERQKRTMIALGLKKINATATYNNFRFIAIANCVLHSPIINSIKFLSNQKKTTK